MLKCVTVTLALVQYLPSCVKCIATGPLMHAMTVKCIAASTVPNFSASRTAVPEIRKMDAHMLTCSCILRVQLHVRTSTFVKHLANGSLITYQISAQSIQPFPRYGKGGTPARAHVQVYPIHDLCNVHRYFVSGLAPRQLRGAKPPHSRPPPLPPSS